MFKEPKMTLSSAMNTIARSMLIIFIAFVTSCQKMEVSTYRGPSVIQPPHSKVITILGSSTAEGQGATPGDSSWVNRLKSQLAYDYKNVRVINLAKGGFTSFNILPTGYNTADTIRNITKSLSYSPDLIVLHLPTNDIAKGYTDQQILNNYEIITNAIISRNISFIIISTQPRDFVHVEARKRLALFNAKLEAHFPGRIVNVYSELATHDFYIKPIYGFGDGVHLNNKGHNIVFQSVFVDSLFKEVFY